MLFLGFFLIYFIFNCIMVTGELVRYLSKASESAYSVASSDKR